MWLTSKQFREKYKISSQHLYQLKKTGKINVKQLFDKTYLIEDIDINNDDREVAIYARVSTSKQCNDLNNQITYLKQYCISNGFNPVVYKDIASGMNENRKGFNELMSKVIEGVISKIVISHKDRLTRFGFGYIENFCNKFGCSIEVINLEEETSKSFQEDLSEDLISIIHHFSMKFYGHRKNKIKKVAEETSKILKENEINNVN